MGSDEPILLYANNASGYSLLSWRPESSTKSNYLAVPGQDRRRDMRLNKAAEAGDPQKSIAEVLKRGGGVWTRVEQADDQFSIATISSPSKGYSPPNRLVVIGPGKIEFRPLSEPMNLRSREYVLMPVDLASEQQLERWIEGLNGLPGDLRDATLQSIVSGGLLDFGRRPPTSGAEFEVPADEGRVPAWVWMVVAGVVGVVLGAAGGYYVPGMLKPKVKAPQTVVGKQTPGKEVAKTPHEQPPAPLPAEIETGMADAFKRLEEALGNSKIEKERTLVENYIGPFGVDSESTPAKRSAEAWMVSKLVMLKRGLPVETAWSRASNEKVREVLEKRPKQLQPTDLEAVLDSFCYAGQNPPGMPADQKPCAAVTLQGAQQALEGLGPAAGKGTPASKHTDGQPDVKEQEVKPAPGQPTPPAVPPATPPNSPAEAGKEVKK